MERDSVQDRKSNCVAQKIHWGGDNLGDLFVLTMIMIIF